MISIITPSYNSKEYILETIKSVQNQSYKNWEMIIIDDCSRDGTLELLEILEKEDSRIKIQKNSENKGPGFCRNLGFKVASGEYICLLDSDDVYIENINYLLERVEEYLKVEKIGALAFNIKNYYSKKPLSHEIPHGNKKLDFNKNLETYYYIGAGHCIRKSTYERAGVYPKDLGIYGGEERDLSFRILGEDLEILYCSDIVIYHKVSPNGRMALDKENFYRYRNQLMVLNRYMNFIPRWSSNILWSLFYYLKKGGKIQYIFQVLREVNGLERYPLEKRKKIEKKIKSLKGRIYY